MEEQFELRLLQQPEQETCAQNWNTKGVFTLAFEQHEVVLTVQVMYLTDVAQHQPSHNHKHDTTSAHHSNHPAPAAAALKAKRKPYVVIGTGMVTPNGEDENGKGRLLVYEMDYAQYTNAQGVTGNKIPKLKLMYAKEHKQGAISMVKQLGAYVLAAVGSKLIVYEVKGGQLVGCAFFDAQLFIVSLNVVKSTYILYGDLYKSVHFLQWKPLEKSLVLLAKDYEHLSITSTEVSVLESKLGYDRTVTQYVMI
jgi:hypothetical protein